MKHDVLPRIRGTGVLLGEAVGRLRTAGGIIDRPPIDDDDVVVSSCVG